MNKCGTNENILVRIIWSEPLPKQTPKHFNTFHNFFFTAMIAYRSIKVLERRCRFAHNNHKA